MTETTYPIRRITTALFVLALVVFVWVLGRSTAHSGVAPAPRVVYRAPAAAPDPTTQDTTAGLVAADVRFIEQQNAQTRASQGEAWLLGYRVEPNQPTTVTNWILGLDATGKNPTWGAIDATFRYAHGRWAFVTYGVVQSLGAGTDADMFQPVGS